MQTVGTTFSRYILRAIEKLFWSHFPLFKMFVSTYPYNYMVHLTDVHVHVSIQLYGTAYRCSCPRIHTIIWYSLQMFMSTYLYNYMVQLTDVHVHVSIQLYGTAYRCSCPRIHTIIWYSLHARVSQLI
jgi:hypothetical protein